MYNSLQAFRHCNSNTLLQAVDEKTIDAGDTSSLQPRTPSPEFFIDPLDKPDNPTHRYLRLPYPDDAIPVQTQSDLLIFPGEVRNIIYRHVLTENDGLRLLLPCLRPHDQAAMAHKIDVLRTVLRNCRLGAKEMSKNQISDKEVDEKEAAEMEAAEKEAIEKEAPKKPAPHEHLRCRDQEDCRLQRSAEESNQLQYVCKKMRKETKGLSLRYNEIHFSSVGQEPLRAEVLALCWIQSLPPKHLATLRRVTITHYPLPDPRRPQPLDPASPERATIDSLIGICARNSHLRIQYALSNWRFQPGSFSMIERGVLLLYSFRGIDLSHALPDQYTKHSGTIQKILAGWRRRFKLTPVKVNNFRFVPLDHELIKEMDFKKYGSLENAFEMHVKSLRQGHPYGDQERMWVKWMLNFYLRGV